MNAVRMREHALAVAERAIHICIDGESIDALEIARRLRDSLSEREAMEKLERAKEASKMAMDRAAERLEYENNNRFGPTIGIEAARYSAAKAVFYAVSHADPKKAAEQAELASASAVAAVAYVAVHERSYPSFAIAERAATAAFKAAFEEEKRWQRKKSNA